MIAPPYVVAMIAVIVTVDVLTFRNHFWERLMVNIGIVLVFAALYLRFLKHTHRMNRRMQGARLRERHCLRRLILR
jgi:Mn2+/Fe2+ NRAMP family transporter